VTSYAGRVKGSILKTYLAAVEKTLSPSLEQFHQSLSDESRRCIAEMHASAMYPEDVLVEMIGAVHAIGGRELVHRVGYVQNTLVIRHIYRWIVALAGPLSLVDRVASLWPTLRDTGRAVASRQGDRAARLLISGHAAMAAPGYAESFGGSACAALDLSGAKTSRVAIQRLANGDVQFDFSW
jgi:hypothetical protein